MNPAQAAEAATGIALLGTGLVLGLRHGVDWDHIAAIVDIAGTTSTVEENEEDVERRLASLGGSTATLVADTAAHKRNPQVRAVWLAFLYALGHAAVVVALGSLALSFGAMLPEWIDPLMERVVGLTLLVLGAWVAYSLVQYWRGEEADFRLRSRWMLVFAGVRHFFGWIRAKLGGHQHDGHMHVDQYGVKTAFGVGMIHGIGAETGSQVLLIAAVGGAGGLGLGVPMMLAFVVGLIISNTFIAVLAATGYMTSSRARPIYLTLGVLTAVFSIVIGVFFVLGIGNELPDLNALLFGGQG